METPKPAARCIAFQISWQSHACMGHNKTNPGYSLTTVNGGQDVPLPPCTKGFPIPLIVIVSGIKAQDQNVNVSQQAYKSPTYLIVNTELAPRVADLLTRLVTGQSVAGFGGVCVPLACLIKNDGHYGATAASKVMRFLVSDHQHSLMDSSTGMPNLHGFLGRLFHNCMSAFQPTSHTPIGFDANWIENAKCRFVDNKVARDMVCVSEKIFRRSPETMRYTRFVDIRAKVAEDGMVRYQASCSTTNDNGDGVVSHSLKEVKFTNMQAIPDDQFPHYVKTTMRMAYNPSTGHAISAMVVPDGPACINAVFTMDSEHDDSAMRATVFRPLLQSDCVDKNAYVHLWAYALAHSGCKAHVVRAPAHPSVEAACAALEKGGDHHILNAEQHAWVATIVSECRNQPALSVLSFAPDMDSAETTEATLFTDHLDFSDPASWPANNVLVVNPDQNYRGLPSGIAMMAAGPAPLLAASAAKRVMVMKQDAGTGKTTTFCSMAIMMALDGIRVQFLTAPHLLVQTALMILEQRRHAMSAAVYASVCGTLSAQKKATHLHVATALEAAGVGNILLGVYENGKFSKERCSVCMVDEVLGMVKTGGLPLKKFDMQDSSIGSCHLLIVGSASLQKHDAWMRHLVSSLRMWHPEGRIPMGCTNLTESPLPANQTYCTGIPDIATMCVNHDRALADIPSVVWTRKTMPWAPQLAAVWPRPSDVPQELRATVWEINTSMCLSRKLWKPHQELFDRATNGQSLGPESTAKSAKFIETELLRLLKESEDGGEEDVDAFTAGVKRSLNVCDSTATALAHIALSKDCEDSNTACAICMESMAIRENGIPVVLPCGHIFHDDCVSPIYRNNQVVCPMCRKRSHVSTVSRVDMASAPPAAGEDDAVAEEPATAELAMQTAVNGLLDAVIPSQSSDVLVFVPSSATTLHTFRRRPESVTAFKHIHRWIEGSGIANMMAVIGVPSAQRRHGRGRTLYILPLSFSTGLNLHKSCDTVLVMGYPGTDISEVDRHQIEGRLRRIGQTHPTLCGGVLVNV